MNFLFVSDKGNFYSIFEARAAARLGGPEPMRHMTRQKKDTRSSGRPAADRPSNRRPPAARSTQDFADLNREISSRYEDLSKRLRQIAEFALKHPNEVA